MLDGKKTYCCSCYAREILEELEKDGLLINSAQKVLDDYRLGVTVCSCLEAKKSRLKYISSDGSGWTRCERCDKVVEGAGHHGVIRNRNNPAFWDLVVRERVLCRGCLENLVGRMSRSKRYMFNKYLRRGVLLKIILQSFYY